MTSPRWFDPKVTTGNLIQMVLLAVGLVAAYYGIIGRIDSQGQEIAQLQATVAQVPSLASHVAVIDNTISINKASRDKAMDAQGERLDKLTDVVALLSQNVAALTATIKANEARR